MLSLTLGSRTQVRMLGLFARECATPSDIDTRRSQLYCYVASRIWPGPDWDEQALAERIERIRAKRWALTVHTVRPSPSRAPVPFYQSF